MSRKEDGSNRQDCEVHGEKELERAFRPDCDMPESQRLRVARYLLTLLAGSLIAVAVPAWVATPASPDGATGHHVLLIGLLLGWQLPVLTWSVKCSRGGRSRTLSDADLRRPGFWQMFLGALRPLPSLLLMLHTCNSWWTPEQLGFTGLDSIYCLWLGGAGFLTYAMLHTWVNQTWPRTPDEADNFDAELWSSPRSTAARAVRTAQVVFSGPMMEELVYRGCCVYLLASIIGTGLAIVFGASLFYVLHLYQGPRYSCVMLIFYACIVALLFSPGGLLSAMVCHMLWNNQAESGARNWETMMRRRVREARRRDREPTSGGKRAA